MELGLKNKTGIITGASRGIGAAIAAELAGEGCNLMLTARNAQELGERADDACSCGAQAQAFPADLTSPTAGAELVAATLAAFGRIDFVVANAGAAEMGDFLELSDADWANGFGLKFFAHLRLLRAAWPHLQKSRGSVVVIAGVAGRTPAADSLITGAVNASLLSLTKGLAARGTTDGVQVNAINPGPIRTDRLKRRLRDAVQAGGGSEADAERRMVADIGVSRIGEPDDIAALVSFMLSGRGSYLHGSLIDMDGGKTKTL